MPSNGTGLAFFFWVEQCPSFFFSRSLQYFLFHQPVFFHQFFCVFRYFSNNLAWFFVFSQAFKGWMTISSILCSFAVTDLAYQFWFYPNNICFRRIGTEPRWLVEFRNS